MAKKRPIPRNRVTKRPRIPRAFLIGSHNKGDDVPAVRIRQSRALSERRAQLGARMVDVPYPHASGNNEVRAPWRDYRSNAAPKKPISKTGVSQKQSKPISKNKPVKNPMKSKKKR